MEKVTNCLCRFPRGYGSKDLKDSLGRFSDDDVVSSSGTFKESSLQSSEFCPHRVDFTSSVEGSELTGVCLAHTISLETLYFQDVT